MVEAPHRLMPAQQSLYENTFARAVETARTYSKYIEDDLVVLFDFNDRNIFML